MKNSFISRLFLVIFLVLTTTTLYSETRQQCTQLFELSKTEKLTAVEILKVRNQALPSRSATIYALSEFAALNDLPFVWHDFGPSDRKIRRLVVAVDIQNEKLMADYREAFNLDKPVIKDQKDSGTLVVEQTWENVLQPEHYVYTYIRSSKEVNDPVYRWGKKDMSWKSSFASLKAVVNNKKGLIGLAQLIELNPAENKNIRVFLDQPEKRGPCKSNNCVAWLTGAELGKTDLGVKDDDRKYLFNELGISRTIAPFEISRRLTHASNERHGAMVVFVDGETGLTTFKDEFAKNLIPEPKIPYASILKNYLTKNPADEAMSVIQDGEKIFVPIAAGASPEAIEAIITRSGKMKNGIDLHVLVNGISAQTFKKGVETTDGKFRVHALFLGGNLRELYKENKVSVIPGNLSDFTRMMRNEKQTDFHYDSIIVRVSPANNRGYHSLGPNHDMVMTILRDRPNIKIIAEVNPNIPFTTGDNRIHKSKITSVFESKTELAGPTTVPANEIDSKIGLHLGQLIDSGATLQVGIGNIFGALPEGLKIADKSEIKISTEMLGDHMMRMIEDGTAIKAEAGFAFGSGNLYKWLHKNQKVKFVSTEYVNSPGRISKIPKFHAVNTALQVDLFGQINATMGPEGRISSPGGQVEFMSGASRSEGGKAIIAIRSTAKNETISSITLSLYKGPITTPQEFVSHVVTEYGIASIRGLNERQRAIALIQIAHPKFRQALAEEAIKSGLLTASDVTRINL